MELQRGLKSPWWRGEGMFSEKNTAIKVNRSKLKCKNTIMLRMRSLNSEQESVEREGKGEPESRTEQGTERRSLF